MNPFSALADHGLIPGIIHRQGIRFMNQRRLAREARLGPEQAHRRKMSLIALMNQAPLVIPPPKAHEQPQDLPVDFFNLLLGPRMMETCCNFAQGEETLEQAENAMLKAICQRANIREGQRILELGCGWGALSLWMAKNYPKADVIAVATSLVQKERIIAKGRAMSLSNLHLTTAEIGTIAPKGRFNRIVSMKHFHHVRNWKAFLERVSNWLEDDGRLFVQVLCRRDFPHALEEDGPASPMIRLFNPGGLLPSDDLMLYFQDRLQVEDHWRLSGAHLQKTADAWLANMRANKKEIHAIMDKTYGKDRGGLWFQRWKAYLLEQSELGRAGKGAEWTTSQYRMKKR